MQGREREKERERETGREKERERARGRERGRERETGQEKKRGRERVKRRQTNDNLVSSMVTPSVSISGDNQYAAASIGPAWVPVLVERDD